MAKDDTKGGATMSTLQQTYDAIVSDDALKRDFVEVMRAGGAEGFLRKRGCDVTEEELEEFLGGRARQAGPLELGDDELKDVAGGSFVDSVECSHKGNTCNCSNNCLRELL
jgi:hypothetical protein